MLISILIKSIVIKQKMKLIRRSEIKIKKLELQLNCEKQKYRYLLNHTLHKINRKRL